MEAIRQVKKRVSALETQLKELEIKRCDLDEELRRRRPPMDYSKLEWRKTLPTNQERVWKDECSLCFATPYAPGGLFTNLKTLTTFSLGHVRDDWNNTGRNAVYLRQQWQWIPEEPSLDSENKEPEVKKLAIGVEGGFQLETEKGQVKKIFSVSCGPNFEEDYAIESAPPELRKLIDAVIQRDDASRQMDVLAWEASNDLFESRYARDLIQLENGVKIAGDPKTWKCAESGVTENLWLNLSTGYIGSGRANWDGTGGTGAALRHYEETGRKYPLVVKLGTITPDGKADVYSYAPDEDSMVLDPLLPQHLAHFGIRVGDLRKTEKTIAEMEVDLNVKYDWSRISEEGKNLEKVSGGRRVGLVNLGNSCYCNSVYQALFSSGSFNKAVLDLRTKLPNSNQPQFDLLQQIAKLGEAMNDPEHNVRPLSNKPFTGSDFVSPRMIKTLLGENHRDFSTPEQQDAADYARHVLDRFSRAFRQANGLDDLSKWFNFELEERIECLQSGKVRYRSSPSNMLQLNVPYVPPAHQVVVANKEEHRDVVPFINCVKATLASPEIVDDFFSNATGKRGQASKTTRMATYPKILMVQLRRFVPSPTGWEGIKLECSIPAMLELDLGGEFRGTGMKSTEEPLPEAPPAVEFVPNQQLVDAIMEQGFSRNGAIRAAKATNNNLEAAVNWVMDHMGDADFNDPLPSTTPATTPTQPKAFVPDPQVVESIIGMGFSQNGAMRAAKATNNDVEASVNWVMEHMGDDDFNDPLPVEQAPVVTSAVSSAAAVQEADEESVGMLMSMGFEPDLAKFALSKCGNNLERAAEYLFSRSKEELQAEIDSSSSTKMPTSTSTAAITSSVAENQDAQEPTSTKYYLRAVISHVGKSTMSGHYVAHVNQSEPGDAPTWVFFNDEKVVLAQNPPLDLGYLFLYEQM